MTSNPYSDKRMPGRALVLPDDWNVEYTEEDGTPVEYSVDDQRRILNLAACFQVADPIAHYKRRAWSDGAKDHGFTLTTSTAKSAGGSGKTTMMLHNVFGLVVGTKRSVLVGNLDSQPSLEEKLLERLMSLAYKGDYALFYHLNGLDIPEDEGDETNFEQPSEPPRTIIHALNNSTFELQGREAGWQLTPPKAIVVDIMRLLRPGYAQAGLISQAHDPTAYAYIIRSHENTTHWEAKLQRACKNTPATDETEHNLKNTYGALHHLMRASAFVYGVHEVLMDMGPGSGYMNAFTLMSSDAFMLPLNIDHKSRSTITSIGNKLPSWGTLYKQSMDATQNVPVDRSLVSPLPDQSPKFLGVVFTRSGLGQAGYSHNKRRALEQCYDRIQGKLMPVLREKSMAFLDDKYQNIRAQVQAQLANVPHTGNFPRVASGVAGVMRDFHQLLEISERECVAVPFLVEELHNYNIKPDGSKNPTSIIDFRGKVASLRKMTMITVDLIVSYYRVLLERIMRVDANIGQQIQQLRVALAQVPTDAMLAHVSPGFPGGLSVNDYMDLCGRRRALCEPQQNPPRPPRADILINDVAQARIDSADAEQAFLQLNFPASYPSYSLCSLLKELYKRQDVLLLRIANGSAEVNAILSKYNESAAAVAWHAAAAAPAAVPAVGGAGDMEH